MYLFRNFVTLEDMLQGGNLHTPFTDQPSVHRLLTHIFTYDLNILHYPVLYDLINTAEESHNMSDMCNMVQNKNKNELFINSDRL